MDDAPAAMSWLVTGQMLIRAAAAFSLLGASVLLGWFIMFHLVLKQIPFVRLVTTPYRFDPLLPTTLCFPPLWQPLNALLLFLSSLPLPVPLCLSLSLFPSLFPLAIFLAEHHWAEDDGVMCAGI